MKPEGWSVQHLGDLLDLSSGKRPELAEEGCVPVYGGNGPMGFTKKSLVEDPTLVIGRVGSPGTVHRTTGPAWISDNALYVSELHKDISLDFLEALLAFANLSQFATSSSHPSLSQRRVFSVPVQWPPKDEREEIAAVLSSVDKVIEVNRHVVKRARRVKEGVTTRLMIQGAYRHSLKPAPNGWTIGRAPGVEEVPDSWEVTRLTSVARLESGHTPSRSNDDYWGGAIPWVSLHDTESLQDRTIQETQLTITQAGLHNSSARLLPAGTVVLSRTATVGLASILGEEMATSQDFANFVCGPQVHARFLMHLFRWMQPVWQSLATGSTHKTVYMSDFKKLTIPLPPLEEQEEIAAQIDALDDFIERHTQQVATLEALKHGLTQDLLTGRVRVSPA